MVRPRHIKILLLLLVCYGPLLLQLFMFSVPSGYFDLMPEANDPPYIHHTTGLMLAMMIPAALFYTPLEVLLFSFWSPEFKSSWTGLAVRFGLEFLYSTCILMLVLLPYWWQQRKKSRTIGSS